MSRGLKHFSGVDTTEEDKFIEAFKGAKQAKKEGRFNLTEIKADDKDSSVQAIALTGKGKELALMLTLPETQKVNNKVPGTAESKG